MLNRIFQNWKTHFRKHLTLRRRLMYWTAGLLLAMGFGLTLLINVITAIRLPKAVHQVEIVELMPTYRPPDEALTPAVTPNPSQFVELPSDQVENQTIINQVQQIATREVRTISLIGIVIFSLFGAVGAYWIAGRALHPVQQLKQLVRDIRVDSLDQRVTIDGAQDEISELADSFNTMMERLEQAFEQQGRFVSDAAHELRTPLANLRTNLEVVLDDPSATEVDYRHMTRTLEKSLERLDRLVNDMLLLAKGEKHLQKETIYLEVLISEILEELKPLAQVHQVTLSSVTAGELTLHADALLLARAVSNLIENGIRYNHPGGTVMVAANRDEHGVRIMVEDTGIGIPAKEQRFIFERFYRVESSRGKNQSGSGLGLSISEHIIHMHGGNIRVESQPKVGSIFTIWLPD